MVSFLLIGSLVLGLISWILPIINHILYKKRGNNSNWSIFSIWSLIACAISLFFQILYYNYHVKIKAWSDLMDTTGAVTLASTVLIVGTLVLNLINTIKFSKKS